MAPMKTLPSKGTTDNRHISATCCDRMRWSRTSGSMDRALMDLKLNAKLQDEINYMKANRSPDACLELQAPCRVSSNRPAAPNRSTADQERGVIRSQAIPEAFASFMSNVARGSLSASATATYQAS